jgi:maleylacetoacetate isomerase
VKLYTYFRSSAAYRARIALNLKGLSVETISIHLQKEGGLNRKPAFRAVNPQMRVPALQLDSGEVLIQSLAIIEYLDELHPQPPLLPRDPLARAKVRALAQIIACDIHPLNNTSVLTRIKLEFDADEEHVGEWYRHWIKLGFAALEHQAAQRPQTKHTFGDQPSLADIVLVPQMANARRFKTDLSPFPRLLAWDEAARQHPAFIKAAPENQKDAKK